MSNHLLLEPQAGERLRFLPHAFYNAGSTRGRIVGTFNPAHFADYFRELARIIDDDGGAPPDHDAWVELYGRYDTTFVDGTPT